MLRERRVGRQSRLQEVAGKFRDVVHDFAPYWGGRPYGDRFSLKYDFALPGSNAISVSVWFILFAKCAWNYNRDECPHYLKTPVDGCNCASLNGKQGGRTFNNCLEWGIDPNRISGGGEPFST